MILLDMVLDSVQPPVADLMGGEPFLCVTDGLAYHNILQPPDWRDTDAPLRQDD